MSVTGFELAAAFLGTLRRLLECATRAAMEELSIVSTDTAGVIYGAVAHLGDRLLARGWGEVAAVAALPASAVA